MRKAKTSRVPYVTKTFTVVTILKIICVYTVVHVLSPVIYVEKQAPLNQIIINMYAYIMQENHKILKFNVGVMCSSRHLKVSKYNNFMCGPYFM